MVFFNYATMQMAAKIVYYGPGLCGKTTNLHHIYSKTSPQSRGEMVSLETETDRTLFFDLLPIDVGVIGGFKTRLQLYTVPGQVFYNTTRKLVLKGVDGIVFVADSQAAMLDANRESFQNLRENLKDIGLALEEIPLVVQLNKRDLPNVASADTICKALDPDRDIDHVEAVAYKGEGVFETLKMISKLTLRTLRRRMTGEDAVKPAPKRDATFRVKEQTPLPSSRTIASSTPLPSANAIGAAGAAHAPSPSLSPSYGGGGVASAAAATATSTLEEPQVLARAPAPIEQAPVEEIEELDASEELVNDEIAANVNLESGVDTRTIADEPLDELPSTQYIPPPPPPVPVIAEPEPEPEPVAAAPAVPEAQPEPPPEPRPEPPPAAAAPEVKHVKVRTSVDVMAELEALRKRATQGAPKKKEGAASAGATSPATTPKRDLHRTLSLHAAPDTAARATSVKVTVSFEDGTGVVQTEEQSIDVEDLANVRSLSVDLKIALD
jgi:mutual gliding-motility protein MglA